ncbi:hypothetical protein LSH36_725g01085 [Paralvinella palmiformis]|uniref:DM13 domain-containing protein n=1 Tax=Paralvinella palmiformis TaxID=53620 RepID=A0AAD9MV02_9ANNE|nr:hypothetical protein LSH36_725g01085 [Paralvinella palmiformis]
MHPLKSKRKVLTDRRPIQETVPTVMSLKFYDDEILCKQANLLDKDLLGWFDVIMNTQYLIAGVQLVLACLIRAQQYNNNKGLLVGSFSKDKSAHGVSGTLYVIDESNLYLEEFNYDGKGPDAYFWISKDTSLPDDNGVILPYSDDKDAILTVQTDMTYILELPRGFFVDDLKYLSVWCKKFSVDFGHILFPSGFKAPRVTDINTFGLNSAHGVSAAKITVLDNKRIRIEQFSYDGLGPDAFFMVGSGAVISSNGVVIPNEVGRPNLLKCLGNFLDIMVRHFNKGIYRRVLAMWRIDSKQKVIAKVLGIAQGTVSKVLKRNRETGVPTPRARPGSSRKTT